MIKGHDIICWGGGEFGQHGNHLIRGDVSYEKGQLSAPEISGRVKLAACWSSHNIVVTVDDKLFAWGNNSSGQLGSTEMSDDQSIVRLTLVPPPPDDVTVISVACGYRHTMIVLDNGQVYACGNNFYAQLGYDFKKETYKENQKCPGLLRFLVHNPVSRVSCGDKHTLFLYRSGTVAAVGQNEHGQIGDGGRCESVVPKLVDLDCRVVSIASGSNHNLAVAENGDVYVWGYSKGCGHRHHDVLSPALKLRNRRVIQASGGSAHSLVLTAGGDVWTWGYGSDGQLGLGQNVLSSPTPRAIHHSSLRHRVSHINCGETFSSAVSCDGRLYMWGKNCHVISPVHTPTTPFYVPTPVGGNNPSVHSVFCGAWHALALLGHPERQPVTDIDEEEDEDEEDKSETDYSSEDPHSVSDSDISRTSDTFNSDADYVEKSIPPLGHRTYPVSSNLVSPNQVSSTNTQNAGAAKRSLPIQVLPSRGQTQLTLAEFYDLSESSPDRNDRTRHVTNNHRIENTSTTSAGSSLTSQQDDTKVQMISPKSGKCQNGLVGNKSGHPRLKTSGLSELSVQDSSVNSSGSSNDKANDTSERIPSNGASAPKVKGHESRRDDNTEGRASRHDGRPQEHETISTSTEQRRKTDDHNGQYKNVSLYPKHVKPLQNNLNSDYLREKSKLSSMGARANTMFISTRTSDRYALPRGSAREKKSSVSLVDINQLQDCVLGNELEAKRSPFTQRIRLDSVTSSTRLSSAAPSVSSEASSSKRGGSASLGKHPRDASTGNSTKTPRARGRGFSPIQTHLSLQIRGYENSSSGQQDPEVSRPPTSLSADITRATLGKTEHAVNLPRSKTVLGKTDRVSKFYHRPVLPSAVGVFNKTLQSTGQSTNVRSLYARAETLDSQTTKNTPFTMSNEPSATQIAALHADTLPSKTTDSNRVVVYSSASSWRSRPSHDTDSSDDPTPPVPQVMEVPCPRQTPADTTGVQTMTIIGCGTRTPQHNNDFRRGFSETKKLLPTKRDSALK